MVARWTNAFRQFHLSASSPISQCAKQRLHRRHFTSENYMVGHGRAASVILLAKLDYRGFELSDFPAKEIFDLEVREVIEPNAPQICNSRCVFFQCDFASVVKLPNIDSCSCFKSYLFFVFH